MSKLKTTFFCQNCGTQYAKWQGQCNSCKQWNTIAEEIIQKEEKTAWKPATSEVKRISKPLKIKEIDSAANLVTVIGLPDQFGAIVKVIRLGNKSVVDGAGIIHIPKNKQRKI